MTQMLFTDKIKPRKPAHRRFPGFIHLLTLFRYAA